MKVTSKICMVKDVGLNGNLFGGNMLAWADEAAAIYAKTETGAEHIVTKAIDSVEFKNPVKVGTIIDFKATTYKMGNTSIVLDLKAMDNKTGLVYLNTRFVMVSVDENGNKKPIRS